MIDRGYFRLYDRATPALEAGDYTLHGKFDFETNPSNAYQTEAMQSHFRVRTPRYRLPPDQVLSTFPPNQGEGAYETRLPQIVLKSRTLPWMRNAAAEGTVINGQTVTSSTPWLALVVIAEGEGAIVHDCPSEECKTAGISFDGPDDVAQGSYLEIAQSEVEKLFPTVADLTLLTHVREVNLDDTEAAMGDDDGFMSVVIANRFPQYDVENCRPMRYTACLINLEGQLDKLPKPTPPKGYFDDIEVFENSKLQSAVESLHSGLAVAVTPAVSSGTSISVDNSNRIITDMLRRGDASHVGGRIMMRATRIDTNSNILVEADAETVLSGDFSSAFVGSSEVRIFKQIGTFDGFSFPIKDYYSGNLLRFPILTSWKFLSTGTGGFRHYMENLDVGLLGTINKHGKSSTLPPCFVPPEGIASDAPPQTSPSLEATETGHVGMAHLTRIGENKNAWYRGPFSPVPLQRSFLPENTKTVLAHCSDQLRMITPDGREDVSLAVAFETGRLLALSKLSFVGAVARWRDEDYGRQYWQSTVTEMLSADSAFLTFSAQELKNLVTDPTQLWKLEFEKISTVLEQDPHLGFGPKATLVQPGSPIDFLNVGNVAATLETGFGLAQNSIQALLDAKSAAEVAVAILNIRPIALDADTGFNSGIAQMLETARLDAVSQLSAVAFGNADLTKVDITKVTPLENYDELEETFEKGPMR